MWWHTASKFYYRLSNGKVEYIDLGEEDGWLLSDNYSHVCSVQRETSYLIHLPNIEIPWEATEDSKCPVPTGSQCQITLLDGRVDTCEGYSSHRHDWALSTQNPITAYKIIDEDYLPSVATVTITEDSATTEPGVVVTVYKTVEDKLTKRLEFLQNLANKFPEIRNEAIKFMECELDGYMNTLWEKDNDNG